MTPSLAQLEERIRAGHLTDETPSFAVGIARAGEIIWEKGFGFADRETGVAASTDIPYSLASITKPITATALMVLVEQGEVDLDRSANAYLGDAKITARVGDANDATVRHLANHTSGLPLHYRFYYEDENETVPPMDELIDRYAILIAPPGERYNYANLGYGILEYIIERITGSSYAEFVAKEVFQPLCMAHSAIGSPQGAGPAVRYNRDGGHIPFYDFDHRGASAAFCSVRDLLQFASFHLSTPLGASTPILSKDTLEEMQSPSVQFYDTEGYGVGWWSDERFGFHTVGHGGSMGGVSTQLSMVPTEGLAIAVFCNTEGIDVKAVIDEILSTLLPDFATACKKAMDEELAERPRFQAPGELVGDWSGHVDVLGEQVGVTLIVQQDGDIHLRVGDELSTLVNAPRWNDTCLRGRALGYLPGDPSRARRNHLDLDLTLRDGRLTGCVSVCSFPEDRAGNGLSYWAELRKS